ncbi:MAG: haloacid dehalogenase superfamily, subfamily variant 3 with third motif having or [Firmicutes bacterium]|nr:haloacid dehalogenase superfamily, subfamily variant 3 with third motif having or [Bacillota bacterium]
MRKYNMMIFDVDGTLLDTSEGIIRAVRYTVEKCGFAEPEEAVMKTFIGPPIKESFARIYGVDGKTADELTMIFRDRYKDVDLLKAKRYDGILTVFESLKSLGIQSAIATYKRQDYAEKIVRHFGFGRYTNIIFGADNENKLKKKDIIEKCIIESRMENNSHFLMIGDSDNDALGARQLGIDFLGVTYGFGFRTKEDIYAQGAVKAVDTAYEILEFAAKGKGQ